MRVLIVTVTTGEGHNSAARSLVEQFKASGVDVVVEDMYKYVSRFMYSMMDKGFLFSVKHMPKQFGQVYSVLERRESVRKFAELISSNRQLAKKFASYFRGYMPDVIITTHVFASLVLNVLKRQGQLSVPLVGVVTDYCLHPMWEDCHDVDYLITASEYVTYEAVRKGFALERIKPFGLPINAKFKNKMDKATARRKLELDENRQTVLVMGGSMGYGNIADAVSLLDAMSMNIQIVCVCGNNEKLYNKLNALETSCPVRVLGYINNVDEYMDAADCIITKPGGLTVTETLVKALPMIVVNPIPGHEDRNVEFLLNSGAAVRATHSFPVGSAVKYLLENPERLQLMENAIRLVAHPDAAERICDFVVEIAEKK